MQNPKVNEQIYAPFVTLILADGSNAGQISRPKAMFMAREAGLDLVMVAPPSNGRPPICKIMDYGKMRYDQSKKEKHQHHNDDVKEVYFGFKTAQHDLETKLRKVDEILSKQRKVRFGLELVGREKAQLREATERFEGILSGLETRAIWTKPSVSQGKKITIAAVLSPK